LCAGATVLLAGLPACGSDRSTEAQVPPPAHHATVEASASTVATRLVHDPRARLDAFRAIPGHPERRIAEWHVCTDADCTHWRGALVVTGDGFAESRVVDVPVRSTAWDVAAAGAEHFVITPLDGRSYLVDLTGRVTGVETAGPAGPMVGSEVPVRSSTNRFLGVDPGTGEAHPLSTPRDVVELDRSPSGRLRAVSMAAYSWSDDGGATWQHLPLHLRPGSELPELIPTASDDVHAVLVGSDGATLFPWVRVLKSTDGRAWTACPPPDGPTAYVDSPVVLPDGRLQLDVEGWSEQRAGEPAPRAVGLYAGDDWSAPQPVTLGAPFGASPDRALMNILDLAVTARSVTVYAQTDDRTTVYASTDGGSTWQQVAAR
jgi:hypothetical protein